MHTYANMHRIIHAQLKVVAPQKSILNLQSYIFWPTATPFLQWTVELA